jgi:hypothetical protein
MACTFMWGKEQGNICLKIILSAGNSEASDGGVGGLSGGGDIIACSPSPNGIKFWEGGCGGGLEMDVSGVM